jgi:hypothetical protein
MSYAQGQPSSVTMSGDTQNPRILNSNTPGNYAVDMYVAVYCQHATNKYTGEVVKNTDGNTGWGEYHLYGQLSTDTTPLYSYACEVANEGGALYRSVVVPGRGFFISYRIDDGMTYAYGSGSEVWLFDNDPNKDPRLPWGSTLHLSVSTICSHYNGKMDVYSCNPATGIPCSNTMDTMSATKTSSN